MGALLPCASRDKPPPARPPVDLAAAWRRAAEVAKLPGPNDDLEELLGERFQTPQKAEYHRARGVLGIDEVAWDGKYRATWNPDAMGFPMAICSVQSVAEVQRVVKYAAQHCLPVGVRLCVAAGRHSHMCMLDNTLVLDLQGLSSVEVFPELHLAKVQGGAQQGQLDVACEPHGLATTAGHNASTGCGGLILQGGHGFLERMFGLVIDNLVEVELVLANGELVKANANEHEDLFWAIRGGGGNFGVVVSFTLRLHPLGPVYAGTQIHAAQAPGEREELLTKFFEKTVNGPDEATGLVVLPCGGPMIEMLVWVGSPSQGQEYFQRRASGPLLSDTMGVKSYHSDVQRFSDPNGTGKAVYQTGVLLPEWSREAAAKISELVQSPRAPNASSAILLLPLGGAVMHMRPEATAYCFRSMKVWVLVSGQFEVDSEERPKVVKWARQVRHELLPFSGGAGYGALDESAQHAATFAQDESEGGAIGIFTNTVQINKERNIFGSNLGRLQQIKAKYDPNNVFRANDNILPAS